jgi:hypothetical protein
MRYALRLVTSAIVAVISAGPCLGQTHLTSPAELERELARDDFIIVVPSSGQPVTGRVIRLTPDGLEIRPVKKPAGQGAGSRDLTIPLTAIQSLERPRDSVRNGVLIGAGAGAGLGAGMFITAFVIDRNEMDEWAPFYLGATAVCTGIGALIGWAIDTARSKPHLTFHTPPGQRIEISVERPQSGGLGIRLAVAF